MKGCRRERKKKNLAGPSSEPRRCFPRKELLQPAAADKVTGGDKFIAAFVFLQFRETLDLAESEAMRLTGIPSVSAAAPRERSPAQDRLCCV